jgi:hypothetical protein
VVLKRGDNFTLLLEGNANRTIPITETPAYVDVADAEVKLHTFLTSALDQGQENYSP